MEIYLLKSAACLALFFAFYKIFLERENMHHLKRFYLIGMVLGAFLIPLITFTQYVEVAPSPVLDLNNINEVGGIVYVEKSLNMGAIILSIIYGLGVLFFLLKFSRNLYRFISKIRKNKRYKNDSFIHVLLKTPTSPHTFLKYIFFDKRKYEAAEIPEEVVLHEETHARERHSLDLIFIELIQVVFWFNPLIYFIKHSIKLNHEFLADRSVLNRGVETTNYQKILLAFSSNANSPQLANSINYSSIKKRFTVMKTKTSKRGIWLRTMLLLPLVAILIYGFSTTQTVEKISEENGASFLTSDLKDTTKEQINYALEYLEGAERNNKKAFVIMVTNDVIMLNNRSSSIRTFADDLNSITQDWEETDYTSAHPSILIKSTSQDFLNRLNEEFLKTEYSKANEGMNIIYSLDANQSKPIVKATPEQLAEYNKLAKKYNTMDRNNMRIRGKELTRMNYVYGLMTPQQKKNAEPYPDIPPPPPAPDAPKAIKVIKGTNDGDKGIPPPPPPPPAPDPLDHIIKIAKKDGSTFYYEGKKVTSDKAIELLKNNRDLNVQINQENTPNPVVTISKSPIRLGQKSTLKMTVIDMPYTGPQLETPEPAELLEVMLTRGSKLYFNGKEISKKEAIKLIETHEAYEVKYTDTPHDIPALLFGDNDNC